MTFEELLEKIEVAPSTNLEDAIGETFELFKNTWMYGLVHYVMFMALGFILYFAVLIPVFSVGFYNMDTNNLENISDALLAGGAIYGIFLFIFLFWLYATVTIGLNRMFHQVKCGKKAKFGEMFYFFKPKYILKTFAISFIFLFIVTIGFALLFFPGLYCVAYLGQVRVVYALNPDLSIGEIMKAGYKLTNKNALALIITDILSFLGCQFAGAVTCGMGNMFVNGLMYLPAYVVYARTVGVEHIFDSEFNIDSIGNNI